MKPRTVSARKRFDATEFDIRSEAWDHTIHLSDYNCPECGHKVRFNSKDFFREHISILTPELVGLIEKFRPLDKETWEIALDFYCPGCEMPVRVIPRPGEEFAMGCYNWELLKVVELPN